MSEVLHEPSAHEHELFRRMRMMGELRAEGTVQEGLYWRCIDGLLDELLLVQAGQTALKELQL